MVKTKIVETTEKYDKDGKLVERITREETTEDDETRFPMTHLPYEPYNPNQIWYKSEPYCTTVTSTNTENVGRPVS